MKCFYCEKDAIIKIPYSKLWLCKDHYIEYIQRRVLETIKRYKLIKKGQKILVGVSGGKDSTSLYHILLNIKDEIGFELIGLHINLGIYDFSKKSLEAIKNFSKEYNTEFIILDSKEIIGSYLPETLVKLGAKILPNYKVKYVRPTCSICGLLRRYILNVVSNELNVDYIALGHHMDDLLPYIIKNFFLQDLYSISKLGPKTEKIDSLVGRIRPLYEISEEETKLYAKLSGIPYLEDQCPFKYGSKRIETRIREFLDKMEKENPGFKISLARAIARNIKFYENKEEIKLNKCKYCGMPTSKDICDFCRITKKAFGEPKGLYVKEKISEILKENKIVS
jgi:uncharacterized protein (TIGR00269 family)